MVYIKVFWGLSILRIMIFLWKLWGKKCILRKRNQILLELFFLYIDWKSWKILFISGSTKNRYKNRHTKFYTKLLYQAVTTIIWWCVYIVATYTICGWWAEISPPIILYRTGFVHYSGDSVSRLTILSILLFCHF